MLILDGAYNNHTQIFKIIKRVIEEDNFIIYDRKRILR